MTLTFSSQAWAQYLEWQRLDPKGLTRLNRLIEECRRTPFQGTGKPERLKQDLSGWWSRRITQEHGLVYRVVGDSLEIAQCRYHY